MFHKYYIWIYLFRSEKRSYLAEASCKLQFLSPTITTGSSNGPYTEKTEVNTDLHLKQKLLDDLCVCSVRRSLFHTLTAAASAWAFRMLLFRSSGVRSGVTTGLLPALLRTHFSVSFITSSCCNKVKYQSEWTYIPTKKQMLYRQNQCVCVDILGSMNTSFAQNYTVLTSLIFIV